MSTKQVPQATRFVNLFPERHLGLGQVVAAVQGSQLLQLEPAGDVLDGVADVGGAGNHRELDPGQLTIRPELPSNVVPDLGGLGQRASFSTSTVTPVARSYCLAKSSRWR